MTDHLEAIASLLEKSTPGEWRFVVVKKGQVHDGSTMVGAVAPGHQIRTYGHDGGTYPSRDGEFIAQVHNLLPALLARVKELEQQNADHLSMRLAHHAQDRRLGIKADHHGRFHNDRAEAAEQEVVRLREERDGLKALLEKAGQEIVDHENNRDALTRESQQMRTALEGLTPYLSQVADRIIETDGCAAHDWLVGVAKYIKASLPSGEPQTTKEEKIQS